MFRFETKALIEIDLKDEMRDRRAGAFVTFEGWVRDHNEGKEVTALEYQAYDALARKEALKILQEARGQFDVLDIRCAHRLGRLQVGDLAVWVGVSAAHRAEAFQACSYVIDELKHRVPIWKKEFYVEGDSNWVNCTCGKHHTESETPA